MGEEVSCEEGKRGKRRRDRQRQTQGGRELTIHTVGVLPLAGVKSLVKKCTTERTVRTIAFTRLTHLDNTSYELQPFINSHAHTHARTHARTPKNKRKKRKQWRKKNRSSEGLKVQSFACSQINHLQNEAGSQVTSDIISDTT